MGTIRVNLRGEPERIVKEMIEDGWANTPEEAIRMALMMYFIKLKEVRMLP